MAGAIAAIGAVGCAATLSLGLVLAGSAAVFGQRLAGAADAAALAAADAASGAVIGVPCEMAETVARSAGAELSRCEIDGLTATVTVSATFARLPAAATARAGPPP
jgi:secretion/DNA translocation related TadE-like protein